MLHLVTGHKGNPHIKSVNIKEFNSIAIAHQSFLTDQKEKFEVEVTSDGFTKKIHSGVGYIRGRMFEIEEGTTETVKIKPAKAGYVRYDAVVATYYEDESGVEGVSINVIEGKEVNEEGGNPRRPSIPANSTVLLFHVKVTNEYSFPDQDRCLFSITEENITSECEDSYAHAEGFYNNSTGKAAHSEGQYTYAGGDGAHSEGINTSAAGEASHASGRGTYALGDYQTVVGKFNDIDETSLFIVGNGENDSNLHNAFSVGADGTIINDGLSAAADLYNPQTMQPVNPSDFSYVYYGTGTPADAGYSAEATYGKSFLNASTGDQFIVRRQDTGHGYTYSFQKTMTNKKSSELAPMVKQVNSGLLILGRCKNLYNVTFKTTTTNGITCTNNGDGTYTLNGTATNDAWFTLLENKHINAGTYKLVGCPSGGSQNTYRMACRGATSNDVGNGVEFTTEETNAFWINVAVFKGVTVNNIVIKPMVCTNLNASYNDFVPYTGSGKNVQEDIASVNASLEEQGLNIHDIKEWHIESWDNKFMRTPFYKVNVGDVLTVVNNTTIANRYIVIACDSTQNNKEISRLDTTSNETLFTIPSGADEFYILLYKDSVWNDTTKNSANVDFYINNKIDKVMAALINYNSNVLTSDVGGVGSAYVKLGHMVIITGGFTPNKDCPTDTVIINNIPNIGNISNTVPFVMYDNTANNNSVVYAVINNDGKIRTKTPLSNGHSYRFTVSYVTQDA